MSASSAVSPDAPAPAPVTSTAPPESPKGTTQVQCLPEQYFDCALFKDDNTGTDKLKGLLTGLKQVIHDNYSETECQDLMPDQLAAFYHDVNGDMDQLFKNTPDPSIAFIYKSLGCPYSLQPQPYSSKFVEPTVPALRSEGWIIWTTIQLLLGPEEHSGFLMRAVEKWDIRDPATGLSFPRTLSRECFPAQPDKRMVAWYEGVSERLRREAEQEAQEKERQAALQHHVEHRRVAIRHEDDDASVDSRGPALAYFRNPLYRHVDGRPSIVRPTKRPALSPRPSMMNKAKTGASTVGNVIRNVANPHLWAGPSSAGSSRERERRRRSVPDNRYHHPAEPGPEGALLDDRLPAPRQDQHRRQRSDRPTSSASPDGGWESEERSPRHDKPSGPGRSTHQPSPSLRHSRSHDPTPSQRDYSDYFGAGDGQHHRRGSAFEGQDSLRPPPIGPSFGPSDAPLFAAQVARHPAPRWEGARPSSMRRDEPQAYSPHGSRRDYDPRRDHDVHRRGPHSHRERSRPPSHGRRGGYDDEPRRRYESPARRAKSRDAQRRSMSGRRSAGSDLDSGYSGPEDRDGRGERRQKQTRFAQQPIQGVDGRRYVDDAPWR